MIPGIGDPLKRWTETKDPFKTVRALLSNAMPSEYHP